MTAWEARQQVGRVATWLAIIGAVSAGFIAWSDLRAWCVLAVCGWAYLVRSFARYCLRRG